jgi:predicted nucleic acid-binding protein
LIGVIDASVTLSWVYTDEHSAASDALLARVAVQGAVVPALWRLEVASALQNGVKRKRIDAAYRDSAIKKLFLLPIEIDSETNEYAWTTTMQLAETHQITVYDASYLELALRRCLPLATRDEQLAAAAVSAGAILLPTH